VKSIFFFNSMLTPKLVTGLYWLLLLIALASGLGTMFGGYGGVRLENIAIGLLCELMIVIFKINENLQSLKEVKERSDV